MTTIHNPTRQTPGEKKRVTDRSAVPAAVVAGHRERG
jgi:hypothetical protein